MVGQHIYVRSRNSQNNAGTWTAAITENIVEKDVVSSFIEPRCNMDELFAQRTLLNNTGNNVLRIYHVNDDITVITRTYWETDRLTETMGRKGAYSISYILTDDDINRFSDDFAGAFDVSCFESYNSLVERTDQGRITINEQYDIFSHRAMSYDPSVFKAVGFDETSFVQLMNGIYYAIENKKQLAVLLPENIRRAWEEQGDNTSEKLIYNIMCLLPDYTRTNLGAAAHWNCQIKDKMLSGMHLVFVHPKADEDIAYFKRESVMLLDVNGKYTQGIPEISTDYFSFLWRNIENREVIEDFWKYTKSKFKKLLRGKPNSASAMESVYLIHCANDSDYSDKKQVHKAFCLASDEFAGAGTKVPDAEEFLHKAFNILELSQNQIDKVTLNAVCTMMSEDEEPTSHQYQEYETILHACEIGIADDDTIELLCDELAKENRNAASYFLTYLNSKKNIPTESITLQLIKFLAGIFSRLSKKPLNAELLQVALTTLQSWRSGIYNVHGVEFYTPVIKTFIGYIAGKGQNNDIRSALYDILFDYEQINDAPLYSECSEVLFKEEKRIYKIESDYPGDTTSLRLYANSFFKSLRDISKLKKEVAVTCFERLFRLAYKGDDIVVKGALLAYKHAVDGAYAESIVDKVIPVLLKCQENTLEQIEGGGAIWNPVKAGKALLSFEKLNFSLIGEYAPDESRIFKLIKWYKEHDIDTYRVCVTYIHRIKYGNRHAVYAELQRQGILDDLYLHIMFLENNDDIRGEIENFLQISHRSKAQRIISSQLLENQAYERDNSVRIFSEWYKTSLEGCLQDKNSGNKLTFDAAYPIILDEYKFLLTLENSSVGFNVVAKQILDVAAFAVFSSASDKNISILPLDTINTILKCIDTSTYEERPENVEMFKAMRELDSIISGWDTDRLDNVCANTKGASFEQIFNARIKHNIDLVSNTERKQYLRMYYDLMCLKPTDRFSVDGYLAAIGYTDKPNLEVGMLLMRLLNQLASRRSSFESAFGGPVIIYLRDRIQESPQNFNDKGFIELCRNVRNRDYFNNSGIGRLLNQMLRTGNLRFDLPMFLLCLLGTVITCAIIPGAIWLFVLLGKINTAVMLSVGIFIFIALLILDICLLPKKAEGRSNRSRRKN